MSAIKKAVEHFKTQQALAEAVGIHQSFVSQMVTGVRRVPAELCPRIEYVTGGAVTCAELRPDVFERKITAA